MVLKSLEIHGFKSFPDRTVLTFGQGITAVVGPNGSGKSNLSDAIRWVLGEQSNKSLRGSKMEDVIFSGTETRRGVGFAEVSLTFDNTGRMLDFDCDDVKVTRRYFRSGDSEYLLNNATVRLKDIQLLFMDTGLGRDGYSIIGQGRIGDIVASKSDERREIFEEAAGIAKYRYRKNEAERRLATAEENLLRLRDILQELEQRVGPLKEQSEKATAFLELSGEKKGLEIGLWLHRIDRARDALRGLNAQLELARTHYDEAGAAIEELEQQIESQTAVMQQLAVQMDEVRRAAAAKEEEATRLDSECAVLRNDIFHRGETAAQLRADREQSVSDDASLEAEMARRREEIAAAETATAAARERCTALSEQLEALTRSSDEVTGQLENLSATASELALRAADWRVSRVTAESSLGEITRRLSQVAGESASRATARGAVADELAACERDAAALADKAEGLQNTRRGYEMRLKSRADKSQAQKEEADRLTLDAEAAMRRVHLLAEMERNLEGFSDSVKTVVRQAESGRLRGIHGPVSRRIHAQSDYALAVETALGAAAQNVICDREEDAKRAIQYLKENRAGRVTFLPLSSIKGTRLQESSLPQETGFVGLAVDLIDCEPTYQAIAESLLGRIAVMQTLEDAIAVARKYRYRFRLVTLDGQVINAGGSMTGGSSVRGAGLLSRRSEIDSLKQKAETLKQKAAEAVEKARAAAAETAAAEAQLQGLAAELTTAQEDKIRLDGERRRLSEQLAAYDREQTAAAAETASLEQRAEDCRRAMDEAQSAMQAVAEKQEALERQLNEVSGGRRNLSAQRESLAAQIGEEKLAVLACEKEREAAESALVALQAQQQNAVGHREELARRLAELESQNAETEAKIDTLTAAAAALRGEAADSERQLTALREQRDGAEQQQNAARRASREQSDARETAGRDVARLEERCAAAGEEADTLLKKLYDEYELTRAEAEEVAPPVEDYAAAGRRLSELKSRIRALGSVNVAAIEEYKEVLERYNFLSTQVRDVEVSKAELTRLIGELTGQMRDIFVERFRQINRYFGECFTEMFGGGQASLEFCDPNDILHSGIDMKVQPPGKKILNLDSLSGGEKSLVAIALLFAILRVTPSPFCVLDEIEAALDDANVDRYAQYLRRMCDKTQFIVITHRRGSMEEADVLYGVTMQEKGVSKLLELRAGEIEEKLGLSLKGGE